jgi:hypothetical protein
MINDSWIRKFRNYADYREAMIVGKQAMPDKTVRMLSETEFDKLKWGVGMDEQRNDNIHAELQRRINATESRVDGALGHLYGAEGRGGLLDDIKAAMSKQTAAIEHLDAKFDALILKQEQDKAHLETVVADVKIDVNRIGEKVRNAGAVWKKFRDAGLGAAAVMLITWLGAKLAAIFGGHV